MVVRNYIGRAKFRERTKYNTFKHALNIYFVLNVTRDKNIAHLRFYFFKMKHICMYEIYVLLL